MQKEILFYISSFFLLFWGVSHLFPTRSVVRGFGKISDDNRLIITMEWIVEGLALIFIALAVAAVTYIDSASSVSLMIYWIAAGMLIVLAVVSIFTGFKVKFLPFKLCPVIFMLSAILIVLGMIL